MGRLTDAERRNSVADLMRDLSETVDLCRSAREELEAGHKRRCRMLVSAALANLGNVKHTLKMMLSHRRGEEA